MQNLEEAIRCQQGDNIGSNKNTFGSGNVQIHRSKQ